VSDGLLEYIPQDPDTPYPLGRSVVWHDPRNRAFAALPEVEQLTRLSRFYFTLDVYDQIGPSCTANAGVGVCRTGPNLARFRTHREYAPYDTEWERHELYIRAQGEDPWPGPPPPYDGSSTDAPYKVLRNEGAIAGWETIFGVEELRVYVLTKGPASVGTKWGYDDFYPEQHDGYIIGEGSSAGGHAYRVVGFSHTRYAFRIVNTWGRDWGESGRAWMRYDVMGERLDDDGESFAPVMT